jgi:hypothetical protein
MPVHSKQQQHSTEENHALDEFDFALQLLEFGYYLVLGRPRAGKTTITRLISQHIATHKTAQHIAIAGNQNIRKAWSEIIHPFYIHNGFSLKPDAKGKDISADIAIAALEQIIREQQRRVAECEMLGVPFPKEWEVNLFIDDCGTMKKFMHSPAMKWLSSNRRQIMCNVFVIIQKLTHACTESREAADGVVCLQTGHDATIKGLHKDYVSTLPLKLFQMALAGATQHRGMFIINAHPEKHTIQHMLFFSHADFLHKDGYKGQLEHVGADVHWEYAIEHYKAPVSSMQNCITTSSTTSPKVEELSSDEDSDSAVDKAKPKEPIIPHFTGEPFIQGPLSMCFNRKTKTKSSKCVAG